jgi:hypothetical protein
MTPPGCSQKAKPSPPPRERMREMLMDYSSMPVATSVSPTTSPPLCVICDRPAATMEDLVPERTLRVCWRDFTIAGKGDSGHVPNGAVDCEAHRVDWRATVLSMREDRKDFANREFQLSSELRRVQTVLHEGGIPQSEGDPDGPQRALTTSERVSVLYKRFRAVENRCLAAERNATVVTNAAAHNTRRRLDAEDAAQYAREKRDLDWTQAFAAAVGQDSGLARAAHTGSRRRVPHAA